MSTINPESLRMLQQENLRLRDENRQLHEEIKYLRLAIRALNELDEDLGSITEETDVFGLIENILTYAIQAVNAESGSLLLLDEENNELVFVAVQGPYQSKLHGFRFTAYGGIAGDVVSTKIPALVPDVRLEPRWLPDVDQFTGFETRSLMCVPVFHENRVLGALEIVNQRNLSPFNEDDLDILLLVSRYASLTLVRAEQLTKD